MNNATRRIGIGLPLAALVGLAWLTPNRPHQLARVHAQSTVDCAQSESSTQDFPPVPNTIDSTCAAIPLDMNGTPTQGTADLYGWLTFVAVNWPVNASACAANPQASILTAAPDPTWLSFLADDDVFVASGSPANWCFATGSAAKAGVKGAYFAAASRARAARRAARIAHLPPKVRLLAQKYPAVRLFLHHNAKGGGVPAGNKKRLAASAGTSLQGILEATQDPLTDQNGRFARYTINMSYDEYNYIMTTGSGLWNNAGQQAAGNLSFPFSKQSSPTEVGSMEFKAAWKVLGANDNPSHFFSMQAIVYNDESGDVSPGPNPVTVGLIGLHITHKTAKQKKWLWATFEQVENDTQSFFKPGCPVSQCPPNVETATKPYFELNPGGTPHNTPAQVVAANQPTTPSLNTTFKGLLTGTVWAYYRLVGTQWVGEGGTAPKPLTLGNSVLETFVSEVVPYSCMGCHAMAVDAAGNQADFSWMMLEAQQ